MNADWPAPLTPPWYPPYAPIAGMFCSIHGLKIHGPPAALILENASV